MVEAPLGSNVASACPKNLSTHTNGSQNAKTRVKNNQPKTPAL